MHPPHLHACPLQAQGHSHYSGHAIIASNLAHACANPACSQVRDILAAFFANLGPIAVAQLEKYLADPTLLDKLPEASRALAGDKEALAACLQACQDGHGSRLDGLEDGLVGGVPVGLWGGWGGWGRVAVCCME
jgi:hypothetical protein